MQKAQILNPFFLLLVHFSILLPLRSSAQEQYRIGCIAFYNFENLYDTIDAPGVDDEEFTPRGANRWTGKRYREKLDRLAQVIADMGSDVTPDGPALLGAAEIENRRVLEDLAAHPRLAARHYQIAHHDSPDERGVDVALLYQPKYFKLTSSRPLRLVLYNDDGTRKHTRDILLVSGRFDGEPVHVLVNHWPSRSGGEQASQPYRMAAARLCRKAVDSLCLEDPTARIIVMGDLNDDPVSPSVRETLAAKGRIDQVRPGGLFNPMYELFKKGSGTLAYRDAWNLFDQIMLSYPLLSEKSEGYRFFKAQVFNRGYLIQDAGPFKGYPFRSFAGNNYLGGYSDHFPVYVLVIKPK